MHNFKLEPKHFALLGFVALMLILMAVTFIGSQKSKELRSKAAYPTTPPPPPPPITTTPNCSISASPNPCIPTGGQTTCTSTINWSTTNAAGVCIVVDGTGLFACGLSGSQQAPWITGNTFVVYANYNMSLSVPQNLSSQTLKELCRVTVTGSKATTPTPTSALNPAPVIISAIPNFGDDPWSMKVWGNNLNSNIVAQLFDVDGVTKMGRDYPTKYGGYPTNPWVYFTVSGNVPPSSQCNYYFSTCAVFVRLLDTKTLLISNKFSFVIPQVTATPILSPIPSPIPSGSISASPNPCISGTCVSSTVSWNTNNVSNVAILRSPNPMSDYWVFSQGVPSGSQNTNFQTIWWPDTLVLYANYNTSLTPQQNISGGKLKELGRVTLTTVLPSSTPTPAVSPTPTSTPAVSPTPTSTPAVSPTPTSVPGNTCPATKGKGDADCNGAIDGIDYSIWLNSQCHPMGNEKCSDFKADFNSDGNVDDDDYQIWYNGRNT